MEFIERIIVDSAIDIGERTQRWFGAMETGRSNVRGRWCLALQHVAEGKTLEAFRNHIVEQARVSPTNGKKPRDNRGRGGAARVTRGLRCKEVRL